MVWLLLLRPIAPCRLLALELALALAEPGREVALDVELRLVEPQPGPELDRDDPPTELPLRLDDDEFLLDDEELL